MLKMMLKGNDDESCMVTVIDCCACIIEQVNREMVVELQEADETLIADGIYTINL